MGTFHGRTRRSEKRRSFSFQGKWKHSVSYLTRGGCIIHFANSSPLWSLILFAFSGENGWNRLFSLSRSGVLHAKIPLQPRHRYQSCSRRGRTTPSKTHSTFRKCVLCRLFSSLLSPSTNRQLTLTRQLHANPVDDVTLVDPVLSASSFPSANGVRNVFL